MNDYVIVFLRIISIMSLLLVINLILTGKRLIGEMPIFDFLVIIAMGAIVGADIADPKIHHLPTAFAIVVLALFQFVVNKLVLSNRKFERLITFEPTLVIDNGTFLVNNMKKIRYTLDEVLMMLREKDIFNLAEIQYAIIEANGRITVLKKAEALPLTPKDMELQVVNKEIPIVAIIEGKLDEKSLKKATIQPQMIVELAKEQGYLDLSRIFYAVYSNSLGLQVFPYHEGPDDINLQH